MRAVVENHLDVVRTLLAAGADAKARSKNRFTPLLFAAQQGNIEIARLLIAAGADVNEAAPDGIAGDTNTGRSFKPDTEAAALLVAIDSQHEAMARFLLDSGADPNLDGAGRTALHSAVQQAMPELVKALLARGADPNARLTRAHAVAVAVYPAGARPRGQHDRGDAVLARRQLRRRADDADPG